MKIHYLLLVATAFPANWFSLHSINFEPPLIPQKINLRLFHQSHLLLFPVLWKGVFFCWFLFNFFKSSKSSPDVCDFFTGPDEKPCPLTIRLNQDGTFTCEFSTNLVEAFCFIFYHQLCWNLFLSLSYRTCVCVWTCNHNHCYCIQISVFCSDFLHNFIYVQRLSEISNTVSVSGWWA